MAVNPRQDQLEELASIAGSADDGPVIMLNLNRYRERAAYSGEPPGGIDADVSGREAYGRYSAVALGILEREGGQILWYTSSPGTVIGGDDERYDEVIAVEYPSVKAFLALAMDPAILGRWRTAVPASSRPRSSAAPPGSAATKRQRSRFRRSSPQT